MNPEPQKRPTAIEVVNFVGILPKISFPDEVRFYATELGFRNYYPKRAIEVLISHRIEQQESNALFGIVDSSHNVMVDFIYDSIEPFIEACLPWSRLKPLQPKERFFLGAFFRQGESVGYLRISDDGSIEEYVRCSWKEYQIECRFS